MSETLINPGIVQWAADRAKVNDVSLAKTLGVRFEKLQAWFVGEFRPTFLQARKLAKALRIPFGYLYLQHPPEEPLPIPDLRTVGDHITAIISPDLRDVLNDALRKQSWYRDYLRDHGEGPLPFIGRYTPAAPVEEVAADITRILELFLQHRKAARNWEEFLRILMERAEVAGIWVMRNGVVANNTHRPLNIHEFRGFTICDSVAPLVFINGKDAKAAQIFTLIHELAHLWIGQSGISDLSLALPHEYDHLQVERFCNSVAAEVLAPAAEFQNQWQPQTQFSENLEQAACYFRVSSVVAARRAYDLKLVSWQEYFEFYQMQAALWRKATAGGGGSYYRNIRVRNGHLFTEAVLTSAKERRLLLRDAGRLLNVNPAKINRLAREIGLG